MAIRSSIQATRTVVDSRSTTIARVQEKGEVHWRFDEQIDLAQRIVRIDERKHLHVLVANPASARIGVGEVERRDGNPRHEPDLFEGEDGPGRLLGREIDNQVDVDRQASVAVENGGDTTDHDVPDAGVVQRRKDRFEQGHARTIARRAAARGGLERGEARGMQLSPNADRRRRHRGPGTS
jgi:hypothetical protein